MRRILVIALLASGCGGKDSSPDDPVTAWTVSHYDFAVDLETRAAVATLTIDATGAGHCFAIPYRPDLIDGVRIDGEAADVTVADDVLTACGRGVDGETVTLVATLTVPDNTLGISDVGLSTFADAEGNPFTYLLSWVNECDRHGPCDSTPSAFATFRFTVTHDPAREVLCSGTITTPAPGVTVCDVPFRTPTYSTFSAMAGDWTETPLGTWGGVSAALHDTPSTGIAAALQTSSLQGFFEWMETSFGEYPFGSELRIVTANTYWSGFEHPGNIVINDALAFANTAYSDGLTHVTMHEIAHQWAGDETTLASTYDFVWKEAMAEYLTFVYEDERLAPGVSLTTGDAWKYFTTLSNKFPVPEDQPALFAYYGDVYGPGPMVLFRQIEAMYGRAPVLLALQDLLGDERALSVAEVRDALELRTGASLDGYFDAWVFGSGAPTWPESTVAWNDAGGGAVTVSATLTSADGAPRGCKFTVMLTGTAGNAYDVAFDFGPDATPVAPQTVTPGFTVTGAALDPYAECLVYPAGAIREAGEIEPWRAR